MYCVAFPASQFKLRKLVKPTTLAHGNSTKLIKKCNKMQCHVSHNASRHASRHKVIIIIRCKGM